MKLGVDFAKFTWAGGTSHIGPTANEAIVLADEAGFSTIAAMDHFFQIPNVGEFEEPMLDGYTFLSFAAALTARVRLQLMVTGVTYRHPGVLAKVVTSLDVLSGGRAGLGIGAAWFEREHDALGVRFPPLGERYERLDETLRICRQMWSDDDGPFNGTHHQLAETLNSPQCLSQPHPEILIGGMGPKRTLRLAARHAGAVNWFPIGHDAIAGVKATLVGHCDTEGTDPDAIRITMLSFAPRVDDDGAVSDWLTDIAGYAELGVDEILMAPITPDPVREIDGWARVLVPRLADL